MTMLPWTGGGPRIAAGPGPRPRRGDAARHRRCPGPPGRFRGWPDKVTIPPRTRTSNRSGSTRKPRRITSSVTSRRISPSGRLKTLSTSARLATPAQTAGLIDHREPLDPVVIHEERGPLHRLIRADRDRPAGHQLSGRHRGGLLVVEAAAQASERPRGTGLIGFLDEHVGLADDADDLACPVDDRNGPGKQDCSQSGTRAHGPTAASSLSGRLVFRPVTPGAGLLARSCTDAAG